MLQIKIDEETEHSFELMEGVLKFLHLSGEKAELVAMQDTDCSHRIIAIAFSTGILLGCGLGAILHLV